MYQVHDTVLYGADGVCEITALVDRFLLGQKRTFYELHPLYRKDTVLYLPVDNEKIISKLRPVLTREQILEAIHGMPEEDCIWIENENERRESYNQIIRSGDHKTIIRLIKTLYEQRETLKDSGRKMHAADENFLKEAEKLLYEEFAHVLHISRSQVLTFIQNEISS